MRVGATRALLVSFFTAVGLIGTTLVPAAPAHALATGLMKYHKGGHIIEHVKVDFVMWDSWDYGTLAPLWYYNAKSVVNGVASIVSTPYMDRLTEYNTGNESIGRGSFEGAYTLHPAPSNDPAVLGAPQIENVLTNQFNTGQLPGPGPNRVYVIFFPANKTIVGAGRGSNVCGYHQAFSYAGANGVQGNKAYYVVIPWQTECSASVDGLTRIVSHELAETITDPGIYSSWFDDRFFPYQEVADYCGGSDFYRGSDGNTYTFTQTWGDAVNRCL